MNWYVYIVQCANDALYTGVAIDVQKRVAQHNGEEKGGARYTRAHRPVSLVYQEACTDRSTALKREHEIKQLSRIEKQALIAPV